MIQCGTCTYLTASTQAYTLSIMTIEPNSDVVKHSICHCFAASANASKSTVISRDEVPEYLKRGERIWCDIEAPTREDTAWLAACGKSRRDYTSPYFSGL